jgi:hypothetical protein
MARVSRRRPTSRKDGHPSYITRKEPGFADGLQRRPLQFRQTTGFACHLNPRRAGYPNRSRASAITGRMLHEKFLLNCAAGVFMAAFSPTTSPASPLCKAISAAIERWSILPNDPGTSLPNNPTQAGVCALPTMMPGRKITTSRHSEVASNSATVAPPTCPPPPRRIMEKFCFTLEPLITSGCLGRRFTFRCRRSRRSSLRCLRRLSGRSGSPARPRRDKGRAVSFHAECLLHSPSRRLARR